MRVAIEMPKIDYSMEYGVVLAWRKCVGDPVREGEIIADIEAEKVTFELESPATGTLVDIVVAPGDEAGVRTPIAWVDTDG